MKAGIVIPFRNQYGDVRQKELDVLVPTIRHLCKKHNQDYHMYVIIQDDDKPFNKASLMNAAVDICKNDVDYFIFNDVDNIVISDDNAYRYREHTGNICGEINGVKYGDKDNHFGDIILFKKEDFFAINGFPNWYNYWGWEISATPFRLNKLDIEYKRGDAIVKQLTHDTAHRFHGNKNLRNNLLIYHFLDVQLMEGYRDLKYDLNRIEKIDKDRTDCYVTFPAPPYELNRPMTMDEIRALGGNPTQEEYDWVMETYKPI